MAQFTKTHRTAIVLGLLLVMVFLQLAAIQMRSFWEDESVTGRLVHESIGKILEQRGNDNHPPLYWLSVAGWSKIAGSSDQSLKLYSLVWLVAAFLLTYQLAINLFNDTVALISVTLFAFSPLVLTYGHNARYYSMAAALSLLCTYAVYRNTRSESNRWLFIYAIASLVLIYTVYIGSAVMLALNLWWFITWLRKDRKFIDILLWGLAQIFIILTYTPWLTFLQGAANRNFNTLTLNNGLQDLILRIGYLGFAFEVGEFFSPLNPMAWLGIIVSTGVCIYAIKKTSQGMGLLLTILTVAGIVSIAVNLLAVYPQSAWQNLSNRSFFIYPFFLIVLGYGISQLRGIWLPVSLLVLLIVNSIGIFNYFTNRQVIKPILTVPWREIMTDINSRAEADAITVCTNHDVACFYYQTLYGYERISPNQLGNLLEGHPSEIWWIQSSRGEFANFKGGYDEQFSLLQDQYELNETYQYVRHDPQISMLKSRFLGQEDYDYRVSVYKFVMPTE